MKIQEIKINKIKPDPSQPRKTFQRNRIKEMAQSILTEGVINPIEIDEKYMIITGEIRWRSAREAGLKTVPCKVMKLEGKKRFTRQVIENIHHNTMTPMDTAIALKKVLRMHAACIGKSHSGGRPNQGLTWLSKKIGKGRTFIELHFNLLDASPEFKKAVKKGLPYSMVEIIKRTPEPYKETIEKKIIANEFYNRDSARVVVGAMNKAPELSKKIIKTNYKGMTPADVTQKLFNLGVVSLSNEIDKAHEAPKEIGKLVIAMNKWLRENPAEDMGKLFLKDTVMGLNVVKGNITKWLKGKEVDGGIIEGEVL